MAYPTVIAAKAADHTYVQCASSGKAWSCWGGNTGGNPIIQGQGSTIRADKIAGSNERAGITCYLVNGVCHQAANRILFPAGVLVSAARGYWLSSALFGPYGKNSLWPCQSTFNQHDGVSGDLPECSGPAVTTMAPVPSDVTMAAERQYIEQALAIYSVVSPLAGEATATPELALRLFDLQAEYRLQSALDRSLSGQLSTIRSSLEDALTLNNRLFANKEKDAAEFVTEFNRLVVAFQNEVANTLPPEQYSDLLGVDPETPILLADPSIVEAVYGTNMEP